MQDILLEEIESKLNKSNKKNKLAVLNKILTSYNFSVFKTESLHSIKEKISNLMDEEYHPKNIDSRIIFLLIYIILLGIDFILPLNFLANIIITTVLYRLSRKIKIKSPNKRAIKKAEEHLATIDITINNRKKMSEIIDVEYREVTNSHDKDKVYDIHYFNELNAALMTKIMELPLDKTFEVINAKKAITTALNSGSKSIEEVTRELEALLDRVIASETIKDNIVIVSDIKRTRKKD